MNTNPAPRWIRVSGNNRAAEAPNRVPKAVTTVNAASAPKKTDQGLFDEEASVMTASWVLSPNSASKSVMKAARKIWVFISA